MYKILEVEDKIRVPPSKFNLNLEDALKSSLESKWEGSIDRNLGVVLSIVDIGGVGEGKILPGDGALHYPVKFKVLVYSPQMYEIIKGNVIDVTEFGVFIRLGPVDGMIHVSQIMDDFVSYDGKNSVFSGRDSKRVMKENDIIKARIISVSMSSDNQYKLGLTTRQPGLGVLSWLEKEKAEKKPKAKPAQAPKKKKK